MELLVLMLSPLETRVFFSPGLVRDWMSGTATNFPVILTLSPGFTLSQMVSLNITSIDLGIPPGGISAESSYTLNFYISVNTEKLGSSYQTALFLQAGFLQSLGSVNLNSCSIPLLMVLQRGHLKAPTISSGLTSVLFVMVPLKLTSCPRLHSLNFLNFYLFYS